MPLKLFASVIVTFQGYGLEGLQKSFECEMPAEPHILRPEALRGHVSKIDPATELSASAAVAMREKLPRIDNERIGIILGTRAGNHVLARQYGDRIRRQASSPVLFSTSGYSICAGLAAFSAKINGPSLVIAGKQSNWADCLIVASNYIARGDADMIWVGQVEVTEDGKHGICGLTALAKLQEDDDAQTVKVHFADSDRFIFNDSAAATLQKQGLAASFLPTGLDHLHDCIETCLLTNEDSEALVYNSQFGRRVIVQRGLL
ncbi:beta-ketoacyl synthase N-terminal-like domain-containing protein [Paenibacillus sp. KS-LC4]|uniref:beta-ketoacyl synthase N-terminal-like domain-containing protein n=1 Tax=Paenibacillus sp. KS-LC4 TaxID=2979727 RepID=UPI0030D3EC87